MGYSYSSFALFDQCPLAWKCRYIKKIPAERSDPLVIGGDAHTFAEKYIKHCTKTGVAQDRKFLELYDFTNTPERLQKEVREIAGRFVDSFLIDFKDPIVEQKLAFSKNWKKASWFEKSTYFRGVMDVFHVEDGAIGPLGVITDHKTNRKIPPQSEIEESFQLKIYAFFGFLLRPDLEEIVVRLNFVRYGVMRTQKQPYIKDDIADVPDIIAQKVARIEKEKKFAPVQGGQCDWCQYTAHCPLVQKALTTIKQEFVLSTKENAEKAAAVLQVAEIATKQLKKRLKEFVDTNGALTVGDQRLDYKLNETLELDAEEVTTILRTAGVSKDIIWSALGVTAAALKKALKGTGEKVALEKALASGTKKLQTRFQWIKL